MSSWLRRSHPPGESAGTYPSRREADRAWARAEADAAAGVSTDLRRAKTNFAAYVTGTWLPHHQLEASTRQRYGYRSSNTYSPNDLTTVSWTPILRRWSSRRGS